VFIRLSYNLSDCFPPPDIWPRNLQLERRTYVAPGSTLNLFSVHFAVDHQGTHLDTPYHFYDQGKRITDFVVEDFVFEHPVVLDVRKGDAALITPSDLTPHLDRLAQCDMLLLRTGFSQYRSVDWMRYARSNPSVSGDAARYLMKGFPGIRAVGIDSISIEYEGSHDHGFPAHHAFLSDPNHPVLLLEDVNLDFDLSGITRVFALPLFIEGIGGFPCTVVAELAG
jgi:arylformamidase